MKQKVEFIDTYIKIDNDNCIYTDYRELIHCKDCKHGFRLDDTNYIVCGRPFASNRETHTEEWFCADGKRR